MEDFLVGKALVDVIRRPNGTSAEFPAAARLTWPSVSPGSAAE